MASLKPTHLPVIPSLLLLSATLFITPKLASFISFSTTVMTYPFPWSLSEQTSITFTNQLTTGQSLYPDPGTLPAFFPIYPPLYFLLTAATSNFLSLSISLMRQLAFYFLSLIIFSLAWFQRKSFTSLENFLLSFLLVAFFTSYAPISSYTPLARTDIPSLGFLALALGYLHQAVDKRSIIFVLAFTLTATLSVITKQSNLVIFLVPLIGLIFHRNRFWFILAIASLSAPITVMLTTNFLSHHNFFYHVFTVPGSTYGSDLFSAQFSQNNIVRIAKAFSPLLFSLALLTFFNRQYLFKPKKLDPIFLFFLLSLTATYKIAGNIGAGLNSFFLPIMASLFFLKSLLSYPSTTPLLKSLVYMILLFQSFRLAIDPLNQFKIFSASNLVNNQLLSTTIGRLPGPVLGDRTDYYQFLNNQPVILEAATFNAVSLSPSQSDLFSNLESQMVNQINAGHIKSAIIGHTHFSSPKIEDAIKTNMVQVDSINVVYLDVPQPGVAYDLYTRPND